MWEPQTLYQQTAVLTDDPDELALRLYRRTITLAELAREAIDQTQWDKLVQWGSKAQDIFWAMAQISRTEDPQGKAFAQTNLYAWQCWQKVQFSHDLAALQAAKQVSLDLSAQLARRLGQEAL
ncbi:MAG: flagellar protein FliS [Firmicutes bacterium]|nr:flagellar protein FliS [Bacillota bacterium]